MAENKEANDKAAKEGAAKERTVKTMTALPDMIGSINPVQGFYRLIYEKGKSNFSLLAMTYDGKGEPDSAKILDLVNPVVSSSTSLGSSGPFDPKYQWPVVNIVLKADSITFDPLGMIGGTRPDEKDIEAFPLNNVVRISAGKNPNEVVFGVASVEDIVMDGD